MPKDRSAKPGEEDSWETLAQNLFGIDFRESSEAADVISADELLDEPQPEAPETVERTAEPELARSVEEDAAFDEEDEGDELDDDAGLEGEAADEQEEQAPAAASEADTYWDVLKDWQWEEPAGDEAPKRSRDSSRRQERGGPRHSSRPASRTESTAPPPPAEFVDDSDFGSGLLGDEAPRTREPAPHAERSRDVAGAQRPERSRDSSEKDEGEGEQRRRRRRRRRRRPERSSAESAPAAERVSESYSGAPAAEEEAADDLDLDTEIETREEVEGREVESAEREDSESEERPSQRRRSRRRRRGTEEREPGAASERAERAEFDSEPAEVEDADEADDVEDVDAAWGLARDEDDDDESAEDAEVRYRNIPTWEEAISYLLDPSRVKAHREHPGSGKTSDRPPSSERGDSPRPRRRRRRRN